jgi:hypothetical protein
VHKEIMMYPTQAYLSMVISLMQMLVIAVVISLMALIGLFKSYTHGGLLFACFILYALTAIVAGEVLLHLICRCPNTPVLLQP